MRKAPSSRSRQLMYIALATTVFSLLSIGYKSVIADEPTQTLVQSKCLQGSPDILVDDACLEFASGTQLTSIKP